MVLLSDPVMDHNLNHSRNHIMKRETSLLCLSYLKKLNWTWDHPRVLDWLARVGIHYTGKPYTLQEDFPEFVAVSLAKFLDLRWKCDHSLQLLNWGWDHPKVRSVELKYRCVGQMPLKGYRELYTVLDKAWFDEGGGF